MGVREIIDEWLQWRRQCITRELEFNLNKMKKNLHLLDGLAAILLDIDKAIKIIRNTELEEDVVPNLMKGFDIDKEQAEYVAEIKLRNINKQYIINRIADRDKLKDDIADTEDLLNSPRRINTLIAKTLKDVAAKFGQPRRTELIANETVEVFTPNTEIADYRLHLMLTRHGYLKKHSLASMRNAGELKTKEDDEIFLGYETENKSEVLFFTDKCNVYKAKTYDFAIPTTDYKGRLLIGFENGKAALFPLSVYETKQNRKKLLNGYSDLSRAIAFIHLEDDEDPDLVARSDLKKAVVFKASLISLKSTRTTQGVQLLASKRGSKMIEIKRLSDVGLLDAEYYRIRKIPAIGYYIKEDSFADKQIGFEDLN